jgi:hypothetical protein
MRPVALVLALAFIGWIAGSAHASHDDPERHQQSEASQRCSGGSEGVK